MVKMEKSNSEILQDVGEAVKAKRLLLNMSQQELADQVGISRISVVNLENAKGNLSLQNLIAIMKVLGMTQNLSAVFSPPEESPALVAKAQKGKTQQRVRRSESKVYEDDEFKWGEDK